VYYGPGMSGKTTNLEIIHRKTPDQNKGELTCIATEGDRTLFFDFMPLNLGNIMGMNTKFQLYTVPGQVYYNSTRKLVLRGADGVIYVEDSAADKMEENAESLRNLEENLREYGRDIRDVPLVIQYNKRDLPNAMTVADLDSKLNARKLPSFEAIAKSGEGVFPTLKALAGLVIENLNRTARKEVRLKPSETAEPTRADLPSTLDVPDPGGSGRSRKEPVAAGGRRRVALAAAAEAKEQPVAAAEARSGSIRPGVPRNRAAVRPSARAEAVVSHASRPLHAERHGTRARVAPRTPKHGIALLLVVLGIAAAAAAVFFVSRG
jgi:signal recognition particle receptor subunit beta